MTDLVWFRSDIRISDNPALFNAAKHASETSSLVIGLLILSPEEDVAHDRSPQQMDFLLRNARELASKLWCSFRIPLLVRIAYNAAQVHEILDAITARYHVGSVYFNNQYEIDELRRDEEVEKRLLETNVRVYRFNDRLIVPPEVLLQPDGQPHQVFTKFHRAWVDHLAKNMHLTRTLERAVFINDTRTLAKFDLDGPDEVPAEINTFKLEPTLRQRMQDLYPEGENAAISRLETFLRDKVENYKKQRDFPSFECTSQMSAYLAIGVVSIRQCLAHALRLIDDDLTNGNPSVRFWIQHLAVREYYMHILVHFPHVCMNRPFRKDAPKIEWLYDDVVFKAWCEGKTGYPIVDAGMRQLNETGWMHNRLRQICASFLTKHLLHDWKLGERYFMQHLIDGDFASNNGSWQYLASVGTDPRGVRIFDPILQARKYDPDGAFVCKWIPELSTIKHTENVLFDPTKSLGADQVLAFGYYPAIVDNEIAIQRARTIFSRAMSN